MKNSTCEIPPKGKKKKSNKPAAIFVVLIGLFVLITVPYSPSQEKLIWNIVSGIFLVGSGIWLWNKKPGST